MRCFRDEKAVAGSEICIFIHELKNLMNVEVLFYAFWFSFLNFEHIPNE